jgi:hypothetical protein
VIPSSLVTSSLALLAFIIAFYALLARERKTPYITRFIYWPAIFVFVSIFLMLVAQALQVRKLGIGVALATGGSGASGQPGVPLGGVALWFGAAAGASFYLGTFWILVNIWRLHCRDVHFRDEVRFRDLALVRLYRGWRKRHRTKPSYEYEPVPVDAAKLKAALESSKLCKNAPNSLVSFAAICNVPIVVADPKVLALTVNLLRAGWLVQYGTCIRHPYDFIHQLETLSGNDWRKIAGSVVVIDAYTPHFGFSDSVHVVRRHQIDKMGVHLVMGAKSYAGIHTATARAFNKLKVEAGGQLRRPTLTIFEGCSALVDLESPEQYRIFLRHVIPSERMWGGMLTLFIEPTASEDDAHLMRGYADVFWCSKMENAIFVGAEPEVQDVVRA